MYKQGLFIKRFLQILENEKLSIADIERGTGIKNQTISDWKNKGNEPSLENLWKLADFLQVEIDYLVGRID